MGLPKRKTIFGVHSVTPYDPATGLPLGDIAKVVGNLTVNLTGELIELQGGSLPFPWDIEQGLVSTESTLLLREYPEFLYEAFLGKAITKNSAESGGNVTTPTNVKGTLIEATTGIADVSAKSGSEADLKTGKYAIKAVSATTVNVYALSDIDFSNGTALTYVDETLKINESPITVSGSGGTVDIPSTGLEITGGSGTVAMTADDTLTFEVRAINNGSQEVIIGDVNFKLPEIGLLCYAQKKGDSAIYELDIFKAKGSGAPIAFAEKAYSEAEIPVRAFYDETKGGVFKQRRIENVS